MPEGLGKKVSVSDHNLLIYYQGIFLTLVHQIKDRILQLVNLMIESDIPEKPGMEKDIKVATLIREKGDILKKIGIKDEFLRSLRLSDQQ